MYSFAKRQIHGSEALRSIAIGDSIEHDIAGGRKAGLATALVLTGLSLGLTGRAVRERVAFHDAVPDSVMPGMAWTG
jgi:ribonucleotide monophosphatase NagD (HAD superfamily)